MANLHLPTKEPLVDPKTGTVTDQWRRFFEQLSKVASTESAGLLPTLSGNAAHTLKGDGTWS